MGDTRVRAHFTSEQIGLLGETYASGGSNLLHAGRALASDLASGDPVRQGEAAATLILATGGPASQGRVAWGALRRSVVIDLPPMRFSAPSPCPWPVVRGTSLTRSWGGESGPWGQSWTREPYLQQTRDLLGLWRRNTAELVSHGVVIDDSGISTRAALELEGFGGGGEEVLIPGAELRVRLEAVTSRDTPIRDR